MSGEKDKHFKVTCARSATDGDEVAWTQINLSIGREFDFEDEIACRELLRRLRSARNLFEAEE